MDYFLLILLWITLIILTFWKWTRNFINFQKNIYTWHCQQYPFHLKLSPIEQEYISNCIRISWCEIFRYFSNPFYKRLSFFCYSIRVNKNSSNNSRIAYGSVMRPNKAFEFAKSVLKERGIELPNLNMQFGGLGWDFEEGLFKVYFRFNDFDKIEKKYRGLSEGNFMKEGLLSFSYKNNKLLETRVYRYNENDAHLFSDKRHDIQKDIQKDIFNGRINEYGKKIIEKYNQQNYLLDTITIKNKDDFTLYFPSLF